MNATLPNGKTPDTITLDNAIGLLEERIAKGGGKLLKDFATGSDD